MNFKNLDEGVDFWESEASAWNDKDSSLSFIFNTLDFLTFNQADWWCQIDHIITKQQLSDNEENWFFYSRFRTHWPSWNNWTKLVSPTWYFVRPLRSIVSNWHNPLLVELTRKSTSKKWIVATLDVEEIVRVWKSQISVSLSSDEI